MIKAVLFDVDNTLLDYMKLKRKSYNAAISAMIDAGLKLNEKEARTVLLRLYKKYGIEHSKIFQKFLLQANGRMDWKILTAGIVAYRKIQAGYRSPYPGIANVLEVLKKRKLKLGIVSDAPSLKAWIRLTETKLADYFDFVIAYDETKRKKPHDLPFRIAIDKLKEKPENILFIGDDPKKDIKGAKKADMKTALALYGLQERFRKTAEMSKPDYFIKKPSDILKILK